MSTVKQMKIVPKKAKEPKRLTRSDRWYNPSSDFGGTSDPMARTYFGRDYQISQTELDYLYEGDWVARRAIDIPANDATREWLTLTHKSDASQTENVNDDIQRLDLQGKTEEAIKLARLYGGCVLLIGAFDGQEVDQPLGTVERVEWLECVDRFHAYPRTFYQDPEDPRFGTPETYTIQRLAVMGSKTMQVHETRLVRFDGAYLPPRLRIRNFGWGAPIYQYLRDAMKDFGVSIQSGASILQDFITLAMKVDNLHELLSSDTGEQELIDRIGILAAERSVHNIAIYGKDEEVTKMGTPTSGLPELIDIFMDVISAAVEIPKSRFFHNQSGRLGGDAGENDLRTHYDNIASMQTNKLTAPVQKAIDILAEPHGHAPGVIGLEWAPLWQLSELEIADQYNKTANGDAIYIQNGVLEPEEVAITRFGGEGVNLGDMVIDTDRREKILKALAKEPIDLDEPEGDLPDDTTGQTATGDPDDVGMLDDDSVPDDQQVTA